MQILHIVINKGANAKRAVYSALSYFTAANFNPNALKIFNNVDKFGVV